MSNLLSKNNKEMKHWATTAVAAGSNAVVVAASFIIKNSKRVNPLIDLPVKEALYALKTKIKDKIIDF